MTKVIMPSKPSEREKKLPLPIKLTVGAVAGGKKAICHWIEPAERLLLVAVIGTTCIFPIDMVKTRLQASSGKYSGPIDCFRKIISTEGGPRALYRGLAANLIGVSPEKAIKLVKVSIITFSMFVS